MGSLGLDRSAAQMVMSMLKNDWNDDEWPAAQGVLAMNVGLTDLAANATLFRDMRSVPKLAILRSLAWIVTNLHLARPYCPGNGKDPFPYYMQPGIPNTVQYVELLRSQDGQGGKGVVLGYRIWVAILDPNLNIKNGFEQLIRENMNRRIEERSNGSGRRKKQNGGAAGGGIPGANGGDDGGDGAADSGGSAAPRPGDISVGSIRKLVRSGQNESLSTEPEAHIFSTADLIRVWQEVTMAAIGDPGDTDRLFSSQQSLTDCGQPYNPYQALRPAAAMNSQIPGVRSEQCELRNYYDDNGLFNGKFPFQKDVFRIHTQYFTPSGLLVLPLPDLIEEATTELRPKYAKTYAEFVAANSALESEENPSEDRRHEVAMMQDLLKSDKAEFEMYLLSLISQSPSLRGGTTSNDLMTGAAIEAIVADRNALMTQRMVNAKRLEGIEASIDPATDFEKYCKEKQDMREQAFESFWRVFTSAPAEKLTRPIITNRTWFKALRPEHKFKQAPQMFKDLSPFANMIVRKTNLMEDVLRVESNFALAHIVHLTVMSAFYFEWSLHPTLLLTGDPGTGKSFLVEAISQWIISSVIMNLTHATERAWEVDQDMSDLCTVREETPAHILGTGVDGSQTAADPSTKDRLTRQASVTLAFQKDEQTGQRTAVMSFCRCMGTAIFLTNEIVHDTSPAVNRMIHIHMRKHASDSASARDSTLSEGADNYSSDISHYYAAQNHGMKLTNFYLFMVFKAIEAKAIPDVDMTVAKSVFTLVNQKLEEHGFQIPDRRKCKMALDLMRTQTIEYAVHMAFFSEFGMALRMFKGTDGKPVTYSFEPYMLKYVVPWMMCTQEIAVFVLSLLDFLFVPKLRNDVLDGVKKTVGGYQVSADAWLPNINTTFRKEYRTEVQTDDSASAPAQPLPSPQAVVADAGSVLSGSASAAATESAAPPSASSSGFRPAGSGGLRLTKAQVNYDYVTIEGAGLHQIVAMLIDRISDKPASLDVLSLFKAMTTQFIDSQPFKMEHGNWIPDPDPERSAGRIPMVIIDTLADNVARRGQNKRISIATALLTMERFTFKNVLESALSYSGQRPQTMITGFPFVHVDERNKCHWLPQVCDVIKVTNDPANVAFISNPFGRSEHNDAYRNDMSLRSESESAASASASASMSAGWQLTDDLDEDVYADFCMHNGIDPSANYAAGTSPASCHSTVWELRTHLETKLGVRFSSSTQSYPEQWSKDIVAHRTRTSTGESAAKFNERTGDTRKSVWAARKALVAQKRCGDALDEECAQNKKRHRS